jgi:hypothetical protein
MAQPISSLQVDKYSCFDGTPLEWSSLMMGAISIWTRSVFCMGWKVERQPIIWECWILVLCYGASLFNGVRVGLTLLRQTAID